MCTAAVIGATIAVGAAGYNVYAGQKATKEAKKQQKAQNQALSALNALSTEQWENYKANYQPLIRQTVGRATEAIPPQEVENIGAVTATRAALPAYREAAGGLISRGVAPTSGMATSGIGDVATGAALSEAAARAGMRGAAQQQAFGRKLGVITTGRGLPGEIMVGEANLARRHGALAEEYGEQAGEAYANAVKWLGIGR